MMQFDSLEVPGISSGVPGASVNFLISLDDMTSAWISPVPTRHCSIPPNGKE